MQRKVHLPDGTNSPEYSAYVDFDTIHDVLNVMDFSSKLRQRARAVEDTVATGLRSMSRGDLARRCDGDSLKDRGEIKTRMKKLRLTWSNSAA